MKSTFVKGLILAGLVAGSGVSFAQTGGAPQQRPPRNNTYNNTNRGPQRPRMTPEQRQAQSEARLRTVMEENGITEDANQDAVLAYLADELKAREPLRQMGAKLQEALGNPNSTDEQIKTLVDDYRHAQEAEKKRRSKAQADLDKQIHYTENARVEAFLMLMGVLGDGQPLMQGRGGRGGDRDGRGGRGGRGGREGGGFGRRGGTNRGNADRRNQWMQRFDTNGDGTLDDQERAAMEAQRQQRSQQRGGNYQRNPQNAPSQGIPADN